MDLTASLKEFARSQGVDLVGVASAAVLNEKAPAGRRPEDILPGAQNVVVFGIHMLDTLLNRLPERTDVWTNYFMLYLGNIYGVEWKVSRFLEQRGHQAIPTSATGFPPKELAGVISFKHCAVEAGFGTFSTSNLLVTPEYGPRVRLGAIVTTAPLEHDKPMERDVCKENHEKCKFACVRGCPVDALSASGKIEKYTCYRYYFTLPIWSSYMEDGKTFRCGLCITNCPVGEKVLWDGYELDPEGRRKRADKLNEGISQVKMAKQLGIYYDRIEQYPELLLEEQK